MPILSYISYDRFGAPYDASAIVTDSLFDIEKYKAYSPLMIPATLLVAYGVTFASLTAMFTHTLRMCSLPLINYNVF